MEKKENFVLSVSGLWATFLAFFRGKYSTYFLFRGGFFGQSRFFSWEIDAYTIFWVSTLKIYFTFCSAMCVYSFIFFIIIFPKKNTFCLLSLICKNGRPSFLSLFLSHPQTQRDLLAIAFASFSKKGAFKQAKKKSKKGS